MAGELHLMSIREFIVNKLYSSVIAAADWLVIKCKCSVNTV